MTGFVVMMAAGAALAIAISLCADLLPRRMDVRRLTDWPFKDMPSTNGTVFVILFFATVAGIFAIVRALG